MLRFREIKRYGDCFYLCAFSDSNQGAHFATVAAASLSSGTPVPFAGVKQSGLRRDGVRAGLNPGLETKYLCVARLGR